MNTIPGSCRQTAISRSGIPLERGYLYLPREVWNALYAQAKASGKSASVYIETLIPAVCGTSKVKEPNVESINRKI